MSGAGEAAAQPLHLRPLRPARCYAQVVREGLNRLTTLTELRLKSSKAALTLQPGATGRSVLPPCLLKLRLEGCNLSFLPPSVGDGCWPARGLLRLLGWASSCSHSCSLAALASSFSLLTTLARAPREQVTALTALEDLVLSDNVLRDADLGQLSCLAGLRQLTMMGCRMRRVPPSLSALRKLQVGELPGGAGRGLSQPAAAWHHLALCLAQSPEGGSRKC